MNPVVPWLLIAFLFWGILIYFMGIGAVLVLIGIFVGLMIAFFLIVFWLEKAFRW